MDRRPVNASRPFFFSVAPAFALELQRLAKDVFFEWAVSRFALHSVSKLCHQMNRIFLSNFIEDCSSNNILR